MIPPLLRLKLLGTVCPCLEKDEDGMARVAAFSLTSLSIRWHRKSQSAGKQTDASSVVGGLVSGFFGGGGSAGGGGGGGGSSSSYVKVESTLTLVDTISGPALQIAPLPPSEDDRDEEGRDDEDDEGGTSNASVQRSGKTLLLKKVRKVEPFDGGILGSIGGGSSGCGVVVIGSGGRELLRFDVLVRGSSGKRSGKTADSKTRNEIVDQLTIISEWDRRRQSDLGEENDGEEEDGEEGEQDEQCYDDDGPENKKTGILKGKAQKVAHFAKRELELREMKREREKRKARYLKESGGLKYTAIAMANREG